VTVLLDTHALFWWATDDTKLSDTAVATLEGAEQTAVSGITWYELAALVRRERITLSDPFPVFASAIAQRVRTVGISWTVAESAAALPSTFPGDPADRIIYATAQVNGWKLITRDGRMHEHDRARSVVVW
jgi:PIN domain nuclease of toxin-antitoxin system